MTSSYKKCGFVKKLFQITKTGRHLLCTNIGMTLKDQKEIKKKRRRKHPLVGDYI